MYRIARAAGQTRERRAQATHPPRVRPELSATEPSRVWSWDVTALKGPEKGIWYKLYVIIDWFAVSLCWIRRIQNVRSKVGRLQAGRALPVDR